MGGASGTDRFLLEHHEPAYLTLHREGRLRDRVAAALRELEDCRACPRDCHCNRLKGETRAWHTGRYAIVAGAFPHSGEEDCLRGWRGSGTLFFGFCNLRRVLPRPGEVAAACAAARRAGLWRFDQRRAFGWVTWPRGRCLTTNVRASGETLRRR